MILKGSFVRVSSAAAVLFVVFSWSVASAEDWREKMPSGETVDVVAATVSLGTTTGGVASVGSGAAGVMHSLASAAIVGTGVTAGVGALAAANGLAGAEIVNNTLLRDDPALDESERAARAAGRKGSYAGAVAGTAASVATVATAGGAAGITATLASVGGVVGGGLLAGAAALVVAPAVIAGVSGMAVYYVANWIWD